MVRTSLSPLLIRPSSRRRGCGEGRRGSASVITAPPRLIRTPLRVVLLNPALLCVPTPPSHPLGLAGSAVPFCLAILEFCPAAVPSASPDASALANAPSIAYVPHRPMLSLPRSSQLGRTFCAHLSMTSQALWHVATRGREREAPRRRVCRACSSSPCP